ncbi:phosphatidylinositol synthase 1 (CDP-alcohol phosphatidyltransferase1), variant 3 [Balamuthia mandrillaris]
MYASLAFLFFFILHSSASFFSLFFYMFLFKCFLFVSFSFLCFVLLFCFFFCLKASKFGAVLDMVTDRCATTCLLMVLSFFYRDHILYFTAVVALDIASHYAHLYSSLARRLASHKAIDQTANPLLRIYYTNRAALGALCFGNEAFFLLLYVAHFESGPSLFFFNNQEMTLVRVLTMVVAPLMLAKQLMNVIQLKQAATDLAKLDEVEHYGKKQ